MRVLLLRRFFVGYPIVRSNRWSKASSSAEGKPPTPGLLATRPAFAPQHRRPPVPRQLADMAAPLCADPYAVLGVRRDATQSEITSAYRELAMGELHPVRAPCAAAPRDCSTLTPPVFCAARCGGGNDGAVFQVLLSCRQLPMSYWVSVIAPGRTKGAAATRKEWPKSTSRSTQFVTPSLGCAVVTELLQQHECPFQGGG